MKENKCLFFLDNKRNFNLNKNCLNNNISNRTTAENDNKNNHNNNSINELYFSFVPNENNKVINAQFSDDSILYDNKSYIFSINNSEENKKYSLHDNDSEYKKNKKICLVKNSSITSEIKDKDVDKFKSPQSFNKKSLNGKSTNIKPLFKSKEGRPLFISSKYNKKISKNKRIFKIIKKKGRKRKNYGPKTYFNDNYIINALLSYCMELYDNKLIKGNKTEGYKKAIKLLCEEYA